MKLIAFATSIFIGITCLGGSAALAAQAGSALQKAKQEAEAKGYIFLSSQEEIVARAKKEGRIRVLSSQDPKPSKR